MKADKELTKVLTDAANEIDPLSKSSHPVGHPVVQNPSWQPKDISKVPDARLGQGDKL